MLRYLYADEISRFPRLGESMFRDRALQFSNRLGWDVHVDAQGHESDEYDEMNPLYVIWERPDGSHGGSMRFLPTTGRSMVNDHFSHLTGGVHIESPLIWECTRFCLAPDLGRGPRAHGEGRQVSAALALAAGEVMQAYQLSHFIGVFDPRMQRIYRLMGLEPEVIGTSGEGKDKIGVGLWSMDEAMFEPTLKKVGVSREISLNWLHYSRGGRSINKAQTAAIA